MQSAVDTHKHSPSTWVITASFSCIMAWRASADKCLKVSSIVSILQLCVYASTVNADGEKVSMTPRYARINLYNTIQAAKLVVEDPLNEIYVQNPELKSGVTLRLDSSLVVVRDGLQSSDSNAADSWTVF